MPYPLPCISLVTAWGRHPPPHCLDSKIRHANLLGNVLSSLHAIVAGSKDALLLDTDGFAVSTAADRNVFVVNDAGSLATHTADHCVPGIVRQAILDVCRKAGCRGPAEVRRVSASEVHSVLEVFVTGNGRGAIVPVGEMDGRTIGTGAEGPGIARVREIYRGLLFQEGWTEVLAAPGGGA